MHVERAHPGPRPLVSETVGSRLVGWFLKLAGLGLAGLGLLGWLALMTWSAADPSLTHVSISVTRNWLGQLGAIFSDILLQILGFAAIVAFLGPVYAGCELVLTERLPRWRLRVPLFLAALTVLAGALSAVPAPAAWPVNHGLGGAFGDIAFNGVAGMIGVVLPGRSAAVAGLMLFAGGMCLLTAAFDLSRSDLAVLGRTEGRSRRRAPDLGGPGMLPLDHGVDGVPVDWSDVAAPAGQPAFGEGPSISSPSLSSSRAAGAAHYPGHGQLDLGAATDLSSRSMAERFAPPSAAAVAPAIKGRRGAGIMAGLMPFRSPVAEYRRPSLNILKRLPPTRPGAEHAQPVLRGNARLLEDVLGDFGIKAEVKGIHPGPVVTLFEVEPARGTKSSRVVALSDDIARSMSATSARIAVIPARNAIGIELPNVRRETVYLRELLESNAWRNVEGHLPVVLGLSIGGDPVVADLARMPHLLIAGTTGSGKSVGINALIVSLLYRMSPSECRFLMIDPKMLELSVYNGIPHLLAPVVTDPHRAAAALGWAVTEMEERYKQMAQLGVRNIEMFNVRVANARKRGERMGRTVQTGFNEDTGEAVYVREDVAPEPLPYIVIIVDEFADLMAVAGKEIEGTVQRLAQMARAAGIHLVMATQRPSVDVVTGTIKANFPARIAFKVATRIDSRTILAEQGAEQLLGAGDMLYSAGSGQVLRVHGPFVSDEEVERVSEALRAQGEPIFADALVRQLESGGDPGQTVAAGGDVAASDDLYDRAVAVVHRDAKASTSYLQRRLAIGYNRAADLIERMERDGIVGPADKVGRRRVLLGEPDGDLTS